VYPDLLREVEEALRALESCSTDSGTLALHDPLYALRSDLKAEQYGRLHGHGVALSAALETEHPKNPQCRVVLAEMASLGLWQTPGQESPLEAVYRAIGADPSDPEAPEQLQRWVSAQAERRGLLEARLEAVRLQVRKSERFASMAVAIAVGLGLALLLSFMVAGGILESADGLSSSPDQEALP